MLVAAMTMTPSLGSKPSICRSMVEFRRAPQQFTAAQEKGDCLLCPADRAELGKLASYKADNRRLIARARDTNLIDRSILTHSAE